MHDPRFAPSFGAAYIFDATSDWHTQAGLAFPEEGAVQAGLELPPLDKCTYTGKGHIEAMIRNNIQLVQASGMCFLLGYITLPLDSVQTFLRLVTGWECSPEEFSNTAERILAIRQAFNLREGIIPKDFTLQSRPIGQPPQKEGSQANVTVDVNKLRAEYYKAIDWNPDTGKPSKKSLLELGLDDIVAELYPQ